MKRLFLLAALVCGAQACTPAYAQMAEENLSETPDEQITMPEVSRDVNANAGVVDTIKMPDLPTELKLAGLSKSWRRFTVRNIDPNMARNFGGNGPQYEQVLNDLGIGVHFTKGDHLTLGKETYLIAYRVDPGMDPQDLQQEIQQRLQAFWGHGERQPPPRPAGKFSPRATLKLTLLNLRNLGDLQDLRTFEPKTDLLLPKDLREMSNFNLRRLGQTLKQQSTWQPLPLRDANALRQALRNQHMPVTMLREPATNETYHLNTALAGKKVDRLGNRKNLVVVYEATPSSDNTRGVLFADWHVERVPEWKWEQVRAVKVQKPSAKEMRVISSNQMKQLLNYFNAYSRHRGTPTFKDSATVRQWLMSNWGGAPDMYKEPATGQWYLFNTKLSGVMTMNVSNKNQIVAAYEPKAGSDGKRGAIFLDNVVRRIDEKQWKRTLAVKPRLNAVRSPGSSTRVFVNAPAVAG